MKRTTLSLCIALGALLPATANAQDAQIERVRSFQPKFVASDQAIADVNGDGLDDIVAVGRDGEVRTWLGDADGLLVGPVGELELPRPTRALLALVDVDGDGGGLELVELSPDGLRIYPVGVDGGFARRAVPVTRAARNTLRLGAPRFVDIARDINADGRADIVAPGIDAAEIWLHRGRDDQGVPTFEKMARVSLDVRRTSAADKRALTDTLASTFTLPDVTIRDMNGDGRPDLVVADGDRHAYHLQREDGSLPETPDVEVDLELFRDTTPEADIALGRTLAGQDKQRLVSPDLNADGIPDHVIAHRRKVWVFHGGPDGPQFTDPTQVLKVADDVSAVMVLRVDEDTQPDLVLLRVQLPTAATILRGLVAEWSIDLSAVAYAGRGSEGFTTKPADRGQLLLRLPSLLSVIKDPDALLRRFEDVADRFSSALEGDLDGDGRPDVALVSDGRGERPDRIEIWRGREVLADDDGDAILAQVLFPKNARDGEWDLERLLGWIGGLAERRAARLTGGRDPDARQPTGRSGERIASVSVDLDGDGRSEIVLVHETDDGSRVFDVYRLK